MLLGIGVKYTYNIYFYHYLLLPWLLLLMLNIIVYKVLVHIFSHFYMPLPILWYRWNKYSNILNNLVSINHYHHHHHHYHHHLYHHQLLSTYSLPSPILNGLCASPHFLTTILCNCIIIISVLQMRKHGWLGPGIWGLWVQIQCFFHIALIIRVKKEPREC